MKSEAEVVFFSWRTALFRSYDLVHIHWPEDLFRAKNVRARLPKYLLFFLWYSKIKFRRIPVVWTVHNNSPHEGLGRVEAVMLKSCMALVDRKIFMTFAQKQMYNDDRTGRDAVIPHGHYRDSYRRVYTPERTKVSPVILYFGFVRRYKGLEALIESFSLLPSELSEYQLIIAGRANPHSYGDELRARYAEVPKVTWNLDFQSSDATSSLFSRSQLVVLPYRNMINSGTLLLGLSLGRPVLAPKNTVTTEIQKEVGEPWLILYEGELTADDLRDAVKCTEGMADGSSPDLSKREWPKISAEYIGIYRELTRS